MFRSTFCRLAATAFCLGAAAFAQTGSSIKGSFILAEEGVNAAGQPVASLALLAFAENGAVSGRQFTQGALKDIQGTYTAGTAGIGTLNLVIAGANDEGETETAAASYRVIVAPDGDIAAARVDPGAVSTAELAPAGVPIARGSYLLNQKASSRKFARVALLTFDGSGNIAGVQVIDTPSGSAESKVTGSAAALNGAFQSMTLLTATANEDGDSVPAREDFVYLASENELFAIGAAKGPAQLLIFER